MKQRPLPVQRGDIVVRGSRHGIVVSVLDGKALIVPLERDALPRHRADVPCRKIPCAPRQVTNLAARCADRFWTSARAGAERAGDAPDALMQDIDRAIMRENAARKTEELRPGVVPSTLGRGPRWWDCGRKVGGAPSD